MITPLFLYCRRESLRVRPRHNINSPSEVGCTANGVTTQPPDSPRYPKQNPGIRSDRLKAQTQLQLRWAHSSEINFAQAKALKEEFKARITHWRRAGQKRMTHMKTANLEVTWHDIWSGKWPLALAQATTAIIQGDWPARSAGSEVWIFFLPVY